MHVMLESLHTQTPDHMSIFERVRADDRDLYDLQSRFLLEYGNAYTAMRPRFSQHDKNTVFNDIDFIQHLGPDTAHETHPIAQLDIVRRYGFAPELGLVALIHDWGEIDPEVGDVRHGLHKSSTQDQTEAERRSEIIENIFGKSVGRVLVRATADALDPKTEVGADFKLSERVGYMETIIRAADLARAAEKFPRLGISLPKQEVLWRIGSNAHYHIKPLTVAADTNSAIARLLEEGENTLSIVFSRFAVAA